MAKRRRRAVSNQFPVRPGFGQQNIGLRPPGQPVQTPQPAVPSRPVPTVTTPRPGPVAQAPAAAAAPTRPSAAPRPRPRPQDSLAVQIQRVRERRRAEEAGTQPVSPQSATVSGGLATGGGPTQVYVSRPGAAQQPAAATAATPPGAPGTAVPPGQVTLSGAGPRPLMQDKWKQMAPEAAALYARQEGGQATLAQPGEVNAGPERMVVGAPDVPIEPALPTGLEALRRGMNPEKRRQIDYRTAHQALVDQGMSAKDATATVKGAVSGEPKSMAAADKALGQRSKKAKAADDAEVAKRYEKERERVENKALKEMNGAKKEESTALAAVKSAKSKLAAAKSGSERSKAQAELQAAQAKYDGKEAAAKAAGAAYDKASSKTPSPQARVGPGGETAAPGGSVIAPKPEPPQTIVSPAMGKQAEAVGKAVDKIPDAKRAQLHKFITEQMEPKFQDKPYTEGKGLLATSGIRRTKVEGSGTPGGKASVEFLDQILGKLDGKLKSVGKLTPPERKLAAIAELSTWLSQPYNLKYTIDVDWKGRKYAPKATVLSAPKPAIPKGRGQPITDPVIKQLQAKYENTPDGWDRALAEARELGYKVIRTAMGMTGG